MAVTDTALVETSPVGGLDIQEIEHQLGVRDMLESRWAEGKFLCVGLDVTSPEGQNGPLDLFERAKLIVDATKDVAAAYKPNSAFYEDKTSDGFRQLEQLVAYIKHLAPNIPVIWDAKRADIAKTNEGYDHAAEQLNVDGLTIHPYLGGTAVKPLLSNPNRAGFVLAHTSNPGAGEFQHLRLQSGELLWERVVSNVANSEDWQHGAALGIVTGATYPEELAKARYLAGDDIIMLIPGVGTQGGDLELSVRGAMNRRGNGFLINVSSGISGAKDEEGHVTYDSIRDAAIKYHEEIKAVWQDAIENPRPNYAEQSMMEFNQRLAVGLYDTECIKFGEFVLRSGKKSPLYINLRSSITEPELRGNIASIYVDLVNGLEERRGEKFDVLGGIPQAATSYAAIVADRMSRRLVQPRSGGKKDHGVATLVEGIFEPGESIVLIDDLITDGGAKFDMIDQVKEAGLAFGGMAVLLDREQGGFVEMAKRGYPISAATTARHLVVALGNAERISSEQKDEVLAYLQQ